MLKIGSDVIYRDRANRRRAGVVDSISAATGRRLFRVNDRWFIRDGLEAV